MNEKKILLVSFLSVLFFGCVTSCSSRQERKGSDEIKDSISQKYPMSYNIYVENSGSMAGFCDISNKLALETLVDDYYNVLSSQDDINEVALNYINKSVERHSGDLADFKKIMKSKCTEQYTKIDNMLNMMMDSVSKNCVNLLFSDYVFTTDAGNLQMASNAITKMFTKQLKNKDLAVAIYKYMINFNGKYYPGGIRCNKPLPLYVWVFGNKENVRQVTKLPFTTQNCGTYFIQKNCNIDFSLKAESARMITNDKKTIYVSKWKKNRHGDYYEIVINANLKDILLAEEELLTKSAYDIKSSNSTAYEIYNIEKNEGEQYDFIIRTIASNPAPGELRISYPVTTPTWVEDSNFSGTGLPSDSTTYGISYLINGVAKAFRDVSNSNYDYFNIKLNLE